MAIAAHGGGCLCATRQQLITNINAALPCRAGAGCVVRRDLVARFVEMVPYVVHVLTGNHIGKLVESLSPEQFRALCEQADKRQLKMLRQLLDKTRRPDFVALITELLGGEAHHGE